MPKHIEDQGDRQWHVRFMTDKYRQRPWFVLEITPDGEKPRYPFDWHPALMAECRYEATAKAIAVAHNASLTPDGAVVSDRVGRIVGCHAEMLDLLDNHVICKDRCETCDLQYKPECVDKRQDRVIQQAKGRE